jgi:hypothetical protein
MPSEFYTLKTFGTLGGCSSAVVVTCGVCAYIWGFNPKWLALFIAEVLALCGISLLPKKQRRAIMAVIGLSILNGLLIFCQAVGMNTIHQAFTDANTKSSPPGQTASLRKLIEPTPWFTPKGFRDDHDVAVAVAHAVNVEKASSQQALSKLSIEHTKELTASTEAVVKVKEQAQAEIVKEREGRTQDIAKAKEAQAELLKERDARTKDIESILINLNNLKDDSKFLGHLDAEGKRMLATNVRAIHDQVSKMKVPLTRPR